MSLLDPLKWIKMRLREKVFWERNINRRILTFYPRGKRMQNKCQVSNCLMSYVGDVLWFTPPQSDSLGYNLGQYWKWPQKKRIIYIKESIKKHIERLSKHLVGRVFKAAWVVWPTHKVPENPSDLWRVKALNNYICLCFSFMFVDNRSRKHKIYTITTELIRSMKDSFRIIFGEGPSDEWNRDFNRLDAARISPPSFFPPLTPIFLLPFLLPSSFLFLLIFLSSFLNIFSFCLLKPRTILCTH